MIHSRSNIMKIAIISPFAMLSACMGGGSSGPNPAYAPQIAQPVAPPTSANGAIFQSVNGYAALTSGARAAQVGDLVTIALVERTTAVKSNSATTDKSGSFGLTPPSTGPFSFFSPTDVATGGNSSFSGKGQAQQSNALTGEISVTIQEVYPNGNMLVRGEKLMMLNRGEEQVRISGIIRPADIGPDNRVPSNRVANARITYGGSGEIASASKQGLLQRFFSIISPF